MTRFVNTSRVANPSGGPSRLATGAGLIAIGLLLWNLRPPYPASQLETLLLLLVAGALHEGFSRSPSGCRVGSGWPAIGLITAWPELGAAWLLSLHLVLRWCLDLGFRSQSLTAVLQQLVRTLPVLAAVAWARHFPEPRVGILAVPIYLLLVIVLAEGEPWGLSLRKACEEGLWFALVISVSQHGTWALALAIVALIAVFSQQDGGEVEMQASLSRQMLSTESTLRSSQRKFQEDKGRFRSLLSWQAILDNFQGQALQAESRVSVPRYLVAAMVEIDAGCQAGVCLVKDEDDLSLIEGTPGFAVSEFRPLPNGWESGQMLRSPDGERCFYALSEGLFVLLRPGSGAPDIRERRDEFVGQLLVRARLIFRILQQRRELAKLVEQKSLALEQLAESQDRLLQSEKLVAIGQLAAGVAHEINSPLAAIRLQAQMGRRRMKKSDHEGVLRSLETCEQASLRAKAIIDSLLTYSQFSDGVREDARLEDLVEQATRMLEAHFENSQIELRVGGEALAPVAVNGQEIGQILTNILLNAVDALHERTERRRIAISWSSTPTEQRLNISNNGPAIPEEVLERLFDPFFTTKEVGSGTGLGLSIAFRLAQGHGGTITARNQNDWVHFCLILPLQSSDSLQQ